MEDADTESANGTPVIFRATEEHLPVATAGRAPAKSTTAERLRSRQNTPRPIQKGSGRKRFIQSPSPSSKQGSKRSLHDGREFSGEIGGKNKKNLMEELNDAADDIMHNIVLEVVDKGEGTNTVVASPLSPSEGEGTSPVVASPLPSTEGEGTSQKVASPLEETVMGVGISAEVASPPLLTSVGAGIAAPIASPRIGLFSVETVPAHCQVNQGGKELLTQGKDSEYLMRGEVDGKSVPDCAVSQPEIEARVSICQIVDEMDEATRYGTCSKTTKPGASLVTSKSNFASSGKDLGRHLLKGQEESPTLGKKESRDGLIEDLVNKESPASLIDGFALDLSMTQPLQGQIHILKRPPPISAPATSVATKSVSTKETSRPPSYSQHFIASPQSLNFIDEFPLIEKGRTLSLAKNFEKGTQSSAKTGEHSSGHVEGITSSKGTSSSTPAPDKRHADQPEGSTKPVNSISMAERVKQGVQNPQTFEPVNFQPKGIKKLGTASVNEGKASIHFSSDDSQFLADKMGHTIVGKFSHSIPTSHQIQNFMNTMQFVGSFSWSPINAKHVALFIKDAEDYAKLLVGQNGIPVWYVDKHPMRVFKWTPSFDPYFETPVAAVWCNLIGLPMHLFEESALFAIGQMFGNPIQLDHGTAAKTRLSFARICIEIDISKPQPEEFTLDIMGKESTQKIRWDKIPLYCGECKHVGHSSNRCLAHKQAEWLANRGQKKGEQLLRSTKPFFSPFNHSIRGGGGFVDSNLGEGTSKTNTETEPGPSNPAGSRKGKEVAFETEGGSNDGGVTPMGTRREENDGFSKPGRSRRRRGKQQKQYNGNFFIPRSSSQDNFHKQASRGKENGSKAGIISSSVPGNAVSTMADDSTLSKREDVLMSHAKPSYFSHLENGIYEEEEPKDGDGMEEDHQQGGHLISGSTSRPPEEEDTLFLDSSSDMLIVQDEVKEGRSTSKPHGSQC